MNKTSLANWNTSYVAYVANAGLAHSTIKSYLAAVRLMHIENGREDSEICDMVGKDGAGTKRSENDTISDE